MADRRTTCTTAFKRRALGKLRCLLARAGILCPRAGGIRCSKAQQRPPGPSAQAGGPG